MWNRCHVQETDCHKSCVFAVSAAVTWTARSEGRAWMECASVTQGCRVLGVRWTWTCATTTAPTVAPAPTGCAPVTRVTEVTAALSWIWSVTVFSVMVVSPACETKWTPRLQRFDHSVVLHQHPAKPSCGPSVRLHVVNRSSVAELYTIVWSQDSVLVQVTDPWSNGCEFESQQERWDSFLHQSSLCVLALNRCPFHPLCYCSGT